MIGPSQFWRRIGSPIEICSVFSTSSRTSSSWTGRSTYTRELAEHFCPPNPKALRMIPSAASSRSALRETIAGFLPPISTMHGRGQVVENDLKSRIPTSYEPVKTMPSMPGWVWSASPTVSPGPITRLTAPAGRPASSRAWIRFTVESGEAEAGLRTTVLPAMSAAAVGPVDSAIGKLNGLITAKTPWGRRTVRVWTAGSPRLSIGWS